MQECMTVLVNYAYILISPPYTGGQLMETTWRYRNWNLPYHSSNAQFKVLRQVVQLKGGYLTLTVKYSNQLPPENSNALSIHV